MKVYARLAVVVALFLLKMTQGFAVSIPDGCQDAIATNGYCMHYELPPAGEAGIDIYAVFVVSKWDFPQLSDLEARYLDFDHWKDLVAASQSPNLDMIRSVRMSDIVGSDGDGHPIAVMRYYHQSSAIAPPIVGGRTESRAITLIHQIHRSSDEIVYQTALQKEGPFDVPDGAPAMDRPTGLKRQDGTVTFASCQGTDICYDDESVVVYKARFLSYVDLLPDYQAKYMLLGQEALFSALFFAN